MTGEFVIARNPEDGSTLPYLLRIPLGPEGVVLKARETWPRTGKVYCHRAVGWPTNPEIVESTPVRSCVRRGASIDLVLDRGRENRSQFVFTVVRGTREAIFWQTARTAKQARPGVSLPTARAQALADLPIVVDSHERYAWNFSHQQVTTTRRALAAGDYAVEGDDGAVVAAVVVEDRYSKVFGLEYVRPAVVADALAECHARFPQVPIMFCETRALAQEWTYRFLAAALREAEADVGAQVRVAQLAPATPPTPAEIRTWARANGFAISDRGRVPAAVIEAFEQRGVRRE